jgi:TonB-linked SusC/RagA family outer membrane protein
MNKKLVTQFLITVFFFAFVAANIVAQQLQITGHVISAKDKDAIIGANVFIENSNGNGTITGIDGKFSVSVDPNAVLTISYIGYKSKQVKVTNNRPLHIELDDAAIGLDDVVVIGYGSQRKSDLTGGITAVGSEKLQMVSTNNLMDKLTGQVPGLNITSTKARPGEDQTFLIRGENSLSADNVPLVVLDGIPYNGSISNIDPDVIESLSVLKDASSAAIYGSRGSNGVILIQTKKGKKGTTTVSYKGQIGMQEPERRLNMMKGPEYVKYIQDYTRLKPGYTGSSLDPGIILNPSERANYQSGSETDWQDVIFREALTHSHQISVSGGTEKTTYLASLSFLGENGVVKNTDLKRTNLTLNLTQTLNSWLTIGMGTQATQKETGGVQPYIEAALKMSPYGIYKDSNGKYVDYPMDQTLFYNPMVNTGAKQDVTNRSIFISTYADIILPVKGLSFRSNFGYNYRNGFSGGYYGRNTLTGKKVNGQAIIGNAHYHDYTWENLLKYSNTFGKHKIDATALFSVQQTRHQESTQTGQSFVNDDSDYHNMSGAEKNQTVTSRLTETALLSYMGRINYSYANKYMLTLTARSDGYSAFGANDKYAFFPSVAAAWNLSSEDFFEAEGIDMLKIRASYGANGNQAIRAYQTMNRLSLVKYIWGDGTTVNGTFIPSNGVGNPHLKWETTRTFNLGVDFSLWNGRLAGNIDLYRSHTTDLLMYRTVPIMNGYRSIMDNVGETLNKGIEIAVNSINIRNRDFNWTTNVNFSLNRDKIVELRGDGKDDIANRWFIGKPLRVFYDYNVVGTWQTNEADAAKAQQPGAVPGSAKLEDHNGPNGVPDGKITVDDKKIIGSKLPSFLLSMGNQVSYKNFYASVMLNGVFGQWKELHEQNFDRWMPGYNYLSGMNYWTPENPTGKMTSPAYIPYDKHTFYKKMTYVKIKNITVGYNFKKELLDKIGLAGLSVNASVNNLYTFSNVKNALNFDSNDLDGYYRNILSTYPSARSYILSLNLTF